MLERAVTVIERALLDSYPDLGRADFRVTPNVKKTGGRRMFLWRFSPEIIMDRLTFWSVRTGRNQLAEMKF